MPFIKYIEKRFAPESEALIAKCNEVIDTYQRQGFSLTLRQLYYQMVSRNIIENTERSYKRLGDLVNNARLAGRIDWRAIEDRGRNLQALSHWETPASIIQSARYSFKLDKWKGQTYRPEVWVEKQALEGVIASACRPLDVPYFACKGYNSQSEQWAAGQRLQGYINDGYTPIIFHLGDHDPSGIDMTRDNTERLAMFMGGVEVRRLALNMVQVEEWNPPPNPAKEPLALDTPIPTTTGWATMGSIGVGDVIFGSDGKPCRVTGKSDVFEGKECYRFSFACGDSVVCSADHLWTVQAIDRNGGLLTAEQIARCWRQRDGKSIWRVPVSSPIDMPEIELPIKPYTMGAWLGDGTIGEGSFVCHQSDAEILRYIEGDGYTTSRYNEKSCRILGIRSPIWQMGMSRDKHVPQQYLRASYAQRLALMQGMMDTDGTVSKQGKRGGACIFANTRRSLIDGFVELSCSLGMRPNVSAGKAILNGKDYGLYWRVEFYPGDMDVFQLQRKRNRLQGATVAERQKWRAITNVERVPSVPTQCIAVDSPDHLFLCGTHFIATHNTDSRFEDYQVLYGDESWELDALEPRVLVDMIQAAILAIRDDDIYNEVVSKERGYIETLKLVEEHWDDVANSL